MLIVVLLFLLVMAGLGMFGRLRVRPRVAKCRRCGQHKIDGRCACGRG
jgi:hypothetical protein